MTAFRNIFGRKNIKAVWGTSSRKKRYLCWALLNHQEHKDRKNPNLNPCRPCDPFGPVYFSSTVFTESFAYLWNNFGRKKENWQKHRQNFIASQSLDSPDLRESKLNREGTNGTNIPSRNGVVRLFPEEACLSCILVSKDAHAVYEFHLIWPVNRPKTNYIK